MTDDRENLPPEIRDSLTSFVETFDSTIRSLSLGGGELARDRAHLAQIREAAARIIGLPALGPLGIRMPEPPDERALAHVQAVIYGLALVCAQSLVAIRASRLEAENAGAAWAVDLARLETEIARFIESRAN